MLSLSGLLTLGLLVTKGLSHSGPSVETLVTEPATYVPYEMYNIDFCRDRANEWQLNGGTWTWVPKNCKLKSDNSSYNMGWLGRREPLSLDWEDYSCKLEFSYSSTEDGTRSLITYAQSQDSSFTYLNGYECALVKSGGVDYLELYKDKVSGQTLLSSTEVTISDDGVKNLELEVYSQWLNCYLSNKTSVIASVSATDTTFEEGSVGIKTINAETTFKEITCYDLGTLAPTTTVTPTHAPSALPTIADPTVRPSFRPTPYPTSIPTSAPSTGPTPYPSQVPTPSPTHAPTTGPTPYPSEVPTPVPTTGPTPYPSIVPSPVPTSSPTIGPTPYPSQSPSPQPSFEPSFDPTASPVFNPTEYPTFYPTSTPTSFPTATPSQLPTGAPSRVPTSFPTITPTIGPTPYPSEVPTPEPTSNPVPIPSSFPTAKPTSQPFPLPTPVPSPVPTTGPTPYPSLTPTPNPSATPSILPTSAPSVAPTIGPTPYPSQSPSPQPSAHPVFEPTIGPVHPPSLYPTPFPTKQPSLKPTSLPTSPTFNPTVSPTTLSESSQVSAFGTADIGFAVMGVVLLVACLVCCLACIGYNSKRKKRERQNALAWDQISDSISESGSLIEPLHRDSTPDANPMQTDDGMGMESLWPTALFGSISVATTTTTTTTAPTPAVPYQAAQREEEDEDGASMWPGAVKKDGKSEKGDEPSMWPGGNDVSREADDAYTGPEAEVSFFDSIWPTNGKDKGSTSWYGASTEATTAPATATEDNWQFDGDAALNGDSDTVVAPVVADVQEEDGEEFHF